MSQYHPPFGSAPDPAAVWARPGTKGHMARLGLAVGVCALIAVLAVRALITGDFDDSATEKVIGSIISVACMVVTVAGVLTLITLPRRYHTMAAIAVDQRGIWWVNRGRADLTPWQEIAAVGIGHKRPPVITAYSGSPMRRKQDFALEAFLWDPATVDRREPLRHWDVEDEAPAQRLPRRRLRYVLPVASVRGELAHAVQRFAPHLWIGEYEREWNRIPGR